jgi:hypothetical protein
MIQFDRERRQLRWGLVVGILSVMVLVAGCGNEGTPSAESPGDSTTAGPSTADTVAATSPPADSAEGPSSPPSLLYVAHDSTRNGCKVGHLRLNGTTQRLTATATQKSALAFDPAGRIVYYRTGDARTGTGDLRALSLDSVQTHGPATRPRTVDIIDGAFHAFDVHPDGGLVVSVVVGPDQERRDVVVWQHPDGRVDTLHAQKKRGSSVESMLRVHPDGTMLVRRFEWPEESDFWFFDLDANTATPFPSDGGLTTPAFTDADSIVVAAQQTRPMDPTIGVTFNLAQQQATDLVSCPGDTRPVLTRGQYPVLPAPDDAWWVVTSRTHGLCQPVDNWFDHRYVGSDDFYPALLYRVDARQDDPPPDTTKQPPSLRRVHDRSHVSGMLGRSPSRRYLAFLASHPADSASDSTAEFAGVNAPTGLFVYDIQRDTTRLLLEDWTPCNRHTPRNVAIWIPPQPARP